MLHVKMRLLLNNAHMATYNLVTQANAGTALTFMLRLALYNAHSRMQKERHLLWPVGDAMRVLWLGPVPY